jgi:hypothetical protein
MRARMAGLCSAEVQKALGYPNLEKAHEGRRRSAALARRKDDTRQELMQESTGEGTATRVCRPAGSASAGFEMPLELSRIPPANPEMRAVDSRWNKPEPRHPRQVGTTVDMKAWGLTWQEARARGLLG